ncbi:MAG: NHLP bacteriocin export ABC transporter permease/ATPase subunit [Phycisphaeraceae bacterium]|nr:NHLP bacteriocin export ABC transporter permease/ATPase subunit [Phycisphaeraceae bacterium]
MPPTLDELFEMRGTPTATSANQPLPLVDPGSVWLVTRGHIDVVAMTIARHDDATDLQRTHLLRITPGNLLFGLPPPTAYHNVLLLGFGSTDAHAIRLGITQLAKAARDDDLAPEILARIDRWVGSVCSLCTAEIPPPGTHNLRCGGVVDLAAGEAAQPQTGIAWLRPLNGAVRFMGSAGACTVDGDILFPVGKDGWLTADSPCRLASSRSDSITPDDAYWRGLYTFHQALETLIDTQRTREMERDRHRLLAKSVATRSTVNAAFSELRSILNRSRLTPVADSSDSALIAAATLVGRHLGIDLTPPPLGTRGADNQNPVEAIAHASRVESRRVRLTRDWHRRDNGPLLGFLDGGETPVALIPDSATSYSLHNPADGSILPVTAVLARKLDPAAFCFYRCLPSHALTGRDLARFAAHGLTRDVVTVVLMGVAGGLLTLATPIAVGTVFDYIIPSSEQTQLLQITLALGVAAFAAAAFQITRSVALTRVQYRAGSALQAAIWHRLIHLPARFFTRYAAGDLAYRAMGIDTIMSELSTSAITTVVSSVFSVFSLALLFYYSPPAALVALGMILLLVGAIVVCGLLRARYQHDIQESHGKMASLLLQFMNGVSKIRVAAAEDRAFARWARTFARQQRLQLSSRGISNALDTFAAAFPIVTYMVLFAVVARQVFLPADTPRTFTTGSFLAFLSAYVGLLYGLIDLGTTAVGLLNIVPIWKRLSPILEEKPEASETRLAPGPLRGRVEVSNISFRYQTDGPVILQDVSFHADPGEFVAIVGPSGSGKSTLLRILLGFEQPESGTIAYDGFDAAGLDPHALRRQIGVVLQNGDLMPGDIFSNIVGSSVSLTLADAWEAARLAGFDRDIEEMPMGMHTIISESAASLSGGQRQRLMIARALVTRPRIVFFDEATSALDNPTQAIVTQSLDRLRSTRIVIAHRLSTIATADRIYVVDKGRVVQQGNYDHLVSVPGLFYDLVKRQLA